MLCRKPYMTNTGLAYGCGQCLPCRYNKRRVWTHRIMLEAMQYEDNCFLTLTYRPEDEPEGRTLVPKHTQDFLKRLRGRNGPFRFFLVGEYGDGSERPHYHAALFGFKTCVNGNTLLHCTKYPCERCALVRDTWSHGHVMLGTLEESSAGYMAGYVTKKMTAPDDTRLKGRHPEFTRQSLRPGLGKDAMWEVADVLLRYELANAGADVPVALRHGKKELPLGRYLRRHLREMVGKAANAPQETVTAMAAEMLPLRLAARASTEAPSVKTHLIKAGNAAVAGMEARSRIFKKRERL